MNSTTKKFQPIVRPAGHRDIDSIVKVGAGTFTASFGYSIPPSDLEQYLENAYSPSAIATDFSNPLVNFFVACDGPDVVGFVQVTQGTSDPAIEGSEAPVELQRLYVDAKYHGQGAGRALVAAAESFSRENGFKTIWLGVWEENFGSQKAYLKYGFTKVGLHGFKMGTCVQTDWIMSKSL
jgi:ribosomal protein S18 acetylase RimI-like enzyme